MSTNHSTKQATVLALRAMLRPIIRVLIATGFTARDFIEVGKTVYTEVAMRDYGRRGRDANMSRVALLTGLTRREVARLRDVTKQDPVVLDDPMAPLGHVLADWHKKPHYLDANGKPRKLDLNDDLEPLVDQHRGDVPRTTVISELEEHGAIAIEGTDVYVKSRYFMPQELKPQSIERFGRVVGDLSATIVHNLFHEDARFEGRATNDRVAATSQQAFQRFLERRAMELLEEADDWLADHGRKDDDTSTRMGVGIFTIGEID